MISEAHRIHKINTQIEKCNFLDIHGYTFNRSRLGDETMVIFLEYLSLVLYLVQQWRNMGRCSTNKIASSAIYLHANNRIRAFDVTLRVCCIHWDGSLWSTPCQITSQSFLNRDLRRSVIKQSHHVTDGNLWKREEKVKKRNHKSSWKVRWDE